MPFDDLGLAPPVLQAISEAGYTEPTPIQAQAIPLILEGKDVIGASQTGTGKTAAFALPSLSKIEKLGKPQVLVLEPTRELADQVAQQFEAYGKHLDLKVALLYGGVGYGKQDEQLKAGADIVVACPGRLMDHFFRGTVKFKELKILILDEVDRMLDMGFLPQVRKIVNICPWNNEEQTRQTLFFSATMPQVIASFANWCLTDPQRVEIARTSVASTISHAFYPVAMDQRDGLLVELLRRTDFDSAMIFTRTRKEADQVCENLQKEESMKGKVVAMHSDIRQSDRLKALEGFKDGTYKVLVATDVAARGIDVSSVTHVINYRVPDNPDDYVHRIGRTGRAEKEGDAFTLLTADEVPFAETIERFLDQPIERKKLDNFEYSYSALLQTEKPRPIRKPRRGGGRRRK